MQNVSFLAEILTVFSRNSNPSFLEILILFSRNSPFSRLAGEDLDPDVRRGQAVPAGLEDQVPGRALGRRVRRQRAADVLDLPGDHFSKMHFLKMHFSKMHFSKMHFSKMHFRKMHFSKILQIFGGLVLGCIKTKFCKKICV